MNMYLSMGIGMEYGKEKFTVNIEYKTNEVQESLKKDSSNWIKNIEKNLAMKGVI